MKKFLGRSVLYVVSCHCSVNSSLERVVLCGSDRAFGGSTVAQQQRLKFVQEIRLDVLQSLGPGSRRRTLDGQWIGGSL